MGTLGTIGTLGGAVAGGVLGGPIGAGVGMTAGGALGGWLDGAFDSPDPLDPYSPDAGLYDTAALDSISSSSKAAAAQAAARAAPETDWAMSDADRALALEARGRQGKLADEYEAVLRGERESLAQRQLAAGTQRVIQQQANAAANVRGGAGNQLAAFDLAQRGGVAAGVEQNRLAAELRAREESDARAQLAGVLGQMRGQDLSMRGQSQGQAQFDTSTQLQQTALNDTLRRAAWERELAAAQASAGVKAGLASAQQGASGQVIGINAQREQAAQDRKADAVQGATQGGAGLVQMGVANGNTWGGKPAPGPTPAPAPAQPAPAPAQAPADPWADAWEKSGGGSYSAWKDPWGKN